MGGQQQTVVWVRCDVDTFSRGVTVLFALVDGPKAVTSIQLLNLTPPKAT
jgi:hypothetical protein